MDDTFIHSTAEEHMDDRFIQSAEKIRSKIITRQMSVFQED